MPARPTANIPPTQMNRVQTLLAALHRRGYTQEQLAEHCGVSQGTLSKWHTGVTVAPSVEAALRLAELHRIEVNAEIERRAAAREQEAKGSAA